MNKLTNFDSHKDEASAGQDVDFTELSDPFELFALWFKNAEAGEPSDPNAMALATVDESLLPNVRTVLLKDIDRNDAGKLGFVFYTNLGSAKGQELKASPKAALLFHWKSLGRQVRIRGLIENVSDAEADLYFASRPKLSQIGARASHQSHRLESRDKLEEKVKRLESQYEDSVVPRPPHWSGFRLLPLEMEFWQGRLYRLHDRVVFRRDRLDANWNKSLLHP